jgi:hypothetical protein
MELIHEVDGFEFHLILPDRPAFLQAEHIIASAILRSLGTKLKQNAPEARRTAIPPPAIPCVSLRTMQRRLPGVLSCTYGEFCIAMRLGRAVGMLLLRPDFTIPIIVETCGIGCRRTFIRRLNEYTGLSPSQLKSNLLAGKKHGFKIGDLSARWEVPKVLNLAVGVGGINWVRFRMEHRGCRARGRRLVNQ